MRRRRCARRPTPRTHATPLSTALASALPAATTSRTGTSSCSNHHVRAPRLAPRPPCAARATCAPLAPRARDSTSLSLPHNPFTPSSPHAHHPTPLLPHTITPHTPTPPFSPHASGHRIAGPNLLDAASLPTSNTSSPTACWQQAVRGGAQGDLLYSADATRHTVALSARARCGADSFGNMPKGGSVEVEARYEARRRHTPPHVATRRHTPPRAATRRHAPPHAATRRHAPPPMTISSRESASAQFFYLLCDNDDATDGGVPCDDLALPWYHMPPLAHPTHAPHARTHARTHARKHVPTIATTSNLPHLLLTCPALPCPRLPLQPRGGASQLLLVGQRSHDHRPV